MRSRYKHTARQAHNLARHLPCIIQYLVLALPYSQVTELENNLHCTNCTYCTCCTTCMGCTCSHRSGLLAYPSISEDVRRRDCCTCPHRCLSSLQLWRHSHAPRPTNTHTHTHLCLHTFYLHTIIYTAPLYLRHSYRAHMPVCH